MLQTLLANSAPFAREGMNATTLPSYFPPARYFVNIGSLLNVIVPALLFVATIGLLAMLIYAAFKFLTSQGEPEKVEEARNIATYAIIGMLLIFLSFLMVRVINYVFDLNLPI